MRNLNFREKGQSILEVMIALAAASIVISAVVAAVVSALSNESFSIKHNQATQIAQEGLDSMRNISQSDWDYFASYGASAYCFGDDEILIERTVSICPENVGSFIREILVEQNTCIPSEPTPPPVNDVKISAVVRWADGKCTGSGLDQWCHKVTLTSCYFKP